MSVVSVLDYGAGNVGSVLRMIERAGGKARRISSGAEIREAAKLIIPGVGAFDHGMAKLESQAMVEDLHWLARESRRPVLGICLGMQLMCRGSEEGSLPGLGWLDADVVKLSSMGEQNLRVPHMGWNTLRVVRENPIIESGDAEQRFYFVHSYKVKCNDPRDPIALTSYGDDFHSAFQRENILGVQFHPEKSHRFGLELIRRFVETEPC